MALQLYRRHRTECEAGSPEDSRSGQFEEGWRGWKWCACLIYAAGTLGDKFKHQSTGEREWDKAGEVADAWTSAASRTPVNLQPASSPAPEISPVRTMISEALVA